MTTAQRELSDVKKANEHLAGLVLQLLNGHNALVSKLQSLEVLPKDEEPPSLEGKDSLES